MPTFDCCGCLSQFSSVGALYNHCQLSRHAFGCDLCQRKFETPSASQHLRNSMTHASKAKRSTDMSRGKVFPCVFCKKKFATPSAVAMHIESGRHNVTRHQVTAVIHNLGIVPTISVDRRLEGPVVLPTKIVTYTATQSAFNGVAYECYFCHKTFRTRQSLNSHLNSPAHDADEFKCPGSKCGHSFKLVSGLIQHVECGACGLAKFKEVKDRFESLTDQFSRALKF